MLAAVLLSFSTTVKAYEGGYVETFKPNIQMKELENKVQYNYLLSQYNEKKQYSEGLTKCADKNMYYMPNHISADTDGCYDVLGYLDSLALVGSEASYAGIMSADGDLSYVGSDSRVREGSGQFLADHYCSLDFPGSRAMRYGDVKYLYRDGTLPTNTTGYTYVFEGISDIYAPNNNKLVKGEYLAQLGSTNDVTCLNRGSVSSSYRSLKIRTDIAGNVYNTGDTCAAAGHVICVND